MATTVLAHVASMPQAGDLATEALALILNGSPAARGAFQVARLLLGSRPWSFRGQLRHPRA